MSDPARILQEARAVLLVDWPNQGVPRALLAAGLAVFSYSPSRYAAAEVVAERPSDVEDRNIFPPKNADDKGFLVFRVLVERPQRVDIVCTYRPDAELAGILQKHTVPLAAKVLWLQPPPVTSAEARRVAQENGLVLVEGSDIATVARKLGRT